MDARQQLVSYDVLSRVFGRKADNTYLLSYTIWVSGKTLHAQSVEFMNSSKPSNSDCCKPFDHVESMTNDYGTADRSRASGVTYQSDQTNWRCHQGKS